MTDDRPRHFALLQPNGSLFALIEQSAPPDTVPDGAVALTEAQFLLWQRNPGGHRWDNGSLVPHDASPTRPVAPVPKALVIDRLAAAGKLRAFRAALGYGKDDDALSDADLAARERFDAASVVASDDAGVREALQRAGADVDAVLALG